MFAKRLICSWIGAVGLAAGAFCQTYVQFSVGSATFPSSINEMGEIGGSYGDLGPPTTSHGFVRDPGGTITTFDVPGTFGSTIAVSINAAGAITGSSGVGSGLLHGYVRDPGGNFTTFDVPGSISTAPQSINDKGAIVGFYEDSNAVTHGFYREPNGKIFSLDPPGSIQSAATSINAGYAIAGRYQDSNNLTHGFVRDIEGNFTTFDVPGSNFVTSPASINDAGAITGSYNVLQPPPIPPRSFGFVRDPQGNFASFDPGFNTSPASINNEGAITGFYRNQPIGDQHGFVRSPEGTITSFDPPFCAAPPPFPSPTTATSINDEGVITGNCFPGSGVVLGWVRFP